MSTCDFYFRKLGHLGFQIRMGTVPPLMRIEPSNMNQVLTTGIQALARTWKPILVPAIGVAIPLGALTLLGLRLTGADEFLNLLLTESATLEAMTPEQYAEVSIRFIWGSVIALSLYLLATGFINLAVHKIVAATMAGKPISGGDGARFALSKLGVLLLAGAIAVVGISAGLVLFWLPGVWIAVMLSMLTQSIALDDAGVLGSLRKSFFLVRGRWWATGAFLLVVGLLGTVAGWMVQLVAAPLIFVGSASLGSALAYVVGTLVQTVIIAWIAVMATVWYFDLKARKEDVFTETLG